MFIHTYVFFRNACLWKRQMSLCKDAAQTSQVYIDIPQFSYIQGDN